MSEQEIEQHNARQTWREIANLLERAAQQVELAQDRLEDVQRAAWADQLTTLVDQLAAASREAREQIGDDE